MIILGGVYIIMDNVVILLNYLSDIFIENYVYIVCL